MGIYSEYLDQGLAANFDQLTAERKKQLARIGQIRGRDVLVYAVHVEKQRAPISIHYSDLLPFSDQLSNLGKMPRPEMHRGTRPHCLPAAGAAGQRGGRSKAVMNNYDIVFQELNELTQQEEAEAAREATARELDEIEELRKFAADLVEPEPVLLTTTA